MSITKLYVGSSDGEVSVRLNAKSRYVLWHIGDHSPTGFAWGYMGSGPTDLSISILCDALGTASEDELQERWPSLIYDFKVDFVSRWELRGSFILEGAVLDAWLELKGVNKSQRHVILASSETEGETK